MATTTTRRSKRPPLTDEERDARRAAERELMQEAVDALLDSDGWQRWLSVRRHFHTYSLGNQLLIALQNPAATRVTGFKKWLSLGYCVRKGEKSIRIWQPLPPSKAKLEAWQRAGSDPAERPRTHFRLAPVFDFAQVDPIPDFPGGALDPTAPIEPLQGDSLAHLFAPLADFGASIGSPVTVRAVPGGASGYYELDSKRIVVDVLDQTFQPNGQVKTLIHELAHALVRHNHTEEDPELSYAEEEIVAECVAYCACSSAGFDTSTYSTGYLASWSDSAGSDSIQRYAALIDRLARAIEDVIAAASTDEQAAA